MDQIGKVIKLPESMPESVSRVALTIPDYAEKYDIAANIEKILFRRGVPEAFLKGRIADFPESIKHQVMDGLSGGFFISGPCGIGKTYLAAAIMKLEIIRNSQGAYRIDTCVRGIYDARFIPVVSLLTRIKASFSQEAQETEAEIISRISDLELLVLDDLGAEKSSDFVLQTIYTIMDMRSREHKPIIITSNLSLDEIAQKLSDRVASRIAGMCKVIVMTGKDRRLER